MGNVARAILSGGMIAGTIDVGMASLIFREKPPVILCNIAGGLVGESAAHSGGLRMALLGLLLQWAMSLLIAAVFCMVALRLAWLLNKPLLSGLIYGVMIFLVMNYVIVPLSAIGRAPQFSALLLVLNLAAMLLFGVIISMSAHRMMGPGS